MNRSFRFLLPLIAAAFLLVLAGPATAQKVANPGTFNFKLNNGVMKVKTQEFGFDESQNINFNGTVDKNGNISIPTITFPTYPLSASGFNLTVKINVVGPTTGTINPITGAVSLRLKVWIKIDGVPFGGDCRIASSSSPIDLNTLITGTNGSKTGTPYNLTSGTMKIVNATFAVPASSSCGVASGTVDSTVGLPSASGNNSAEFNIKTNSVINRAITPALTASPSSGTAPFATTLNAGGSTFTAGPATYRWDFANDGSIDQITSSASVSHTYTVGGNQTARVQVVDKDGDTADATRSLTVNAYPDLAISAAHTGDFRVGDLGEYRISLNNAGYAATSGPVTVSSILPAGLTYASVSGAGWSCSATSQDLTCSRSAAIAVGANAPELKVNVNVGPTAHGQVEPSFTLAATGDNGAGNNTASDPTTVRATDLKAKVSHPGHAMLPGVDPGNVIILAAENVGDAASSGPTLISDDLPAGLVPLTASGIGWTCGITGQLVTCTHAAPIAPGSTTEPVTVAVDASLEPGSLGTTVQNAATVSTQGDLDPENDTAADPTLILDGQDIGISKSHEGNFTAGKPGVYTLTARNFGTVPTTGPTTVTDELPSSLSFVSVDGGPAWECTEATGIVTCVHDELIAAGSSAPDITLTAGIGVEAIPAIANTAKVTTPDDPNPANDTSTDPAVVQAIDATVSKSHESVLRVGHEGVYILAVRNAGDSPTINTTTVVDDLPTGLSFVSVDGGPDWSCTEAAGTVTCDYAAVLAGGEDAPDITLTVDVGQAAAPAVENTATVTTEDDFTPSNDSSSDSGTVIDIDAAVSISRTGSFRPGQTGTYLISVENIGAVPTTSETSVTAELPAGLEFDSATGDGWTCDELDRIVTCSRAAGLGAETAAPVVFLRANVTPAAVPGVSTTATVITDGDRFPENDTATDTTDVIGPDLAVTSEHVGPFQIGKLHSYTLTVRNVGTGANIGPVVLSDVLPAGFTAEAAYGNGWSCNLGAANTTCSNPAAIGAGQASAPVTFEVTPTALALPSGEIAATVNNKVAVSTAVDNNAANDETTDETHLVAVDLGLQISGPAGVSVGEVTEYQLAVSNHGTAGAEAPATVTHTLPSGFAARVSGGDDWVCSSAGRKINCSYGQDLGSEESASELTIRALAGRTSASSVENSAKVTAAGDVIAGNNSDSLETEVSAAPDLEAGLQARPQAGDRFRVGNDGGYNVTVRNRGTAPTTGTSTAKVKLPAGVTFLGLDSGQGWSCPATTGSTVTCELTGQLAPDQISTFGFLAEISPATAATISAEATVAGADDLNAENDSAVTVTEVARIDLELTRTHRPVWTIGGTGSYGLRVTNPGSAATAGPTTITEILPFGTAFVSAAGDGWTCSVSGRRLSCVTPESLAPGAVSDLEVTLDLTASTISPITATSTVDTADDADRSNNTASEEITVEAGQVTSLVRKVRIDSSKVKATESGIVTVWVSCPPEATAKCRGTLRLASAGRVRASRGKRVRLILGKARFAVAPGRKSPARIALKKTARKALVSNRKIRSKATATNGGGLTATQKSITVRAGK